MLSLSLESICLVSDCSLEIDVLILDFVVGVLMFVLILNYVMVAPVIDLVPSLVPDLCILSGQTKSCHVFLNTIPPFLPETSRLSVCFYLRHCTVFDPVIIIHTFHMSNKLHVPFLITLVPRLTGSGSNSYLTSASLSSKFTSLSRPICAAGLYELGLICFQV